MKEINLRELYPDIYSADIFVEVTDEVWAAIQTSDPFPKKRTQSRIKKPNKMQR